ncbi:MAG: hypothetical protein AAGJ91_03510 [Pseudomonadota bacterium]
MTQHSARDPNDPKGLIRESYRIEGITLAECRSIFMDWALSLPSETPPATAIEDLLGRYGAGAPDHPMTQVLRAGRAAPGKPARRGGWRARRAQAPE